MSEYFKADIYIMSELFVDNDKDKGCNPDTIADHGKIETKSAFTVKELLAEIESNYGVLEHYEENRYETGYEETERDGTHVSNMVSAYIYKMTETPLQGDFNA